MKICPPRKIASLYIFADAAWVDFDNSPPCIALLLDWDNGRFPGEQTADDIRKRFRDVCYLFLEKKHGHLPPGTIEIRDEFDGADNVYVAYHQY